ncbi:hypothetical protein PV689_05395 [Streptomyces sp. ATCC51928]|uniref:Secreted protein n=1 Tax=Streptomyces caviscabies TaxID=90079 RepID=A0ABW2M5I5_9ACTN|nr:MULTISPECIES: hypothetical protein [unclassified Streptomyces]MCL6286687.1 hypothetical protein [Streptomyces sp. 43Y-GA-1]MDX3501342.1 hypothetical protein [Streptomyces sp. ATCC51928]MDX5521540.1 hypothetical protein [Streptomyces sp. DE06-01C]
MNLHKRFATVAMTGALIGGGLLATGSATAATPGEVVAQSCYGNAKTYTKAAGTQIYPNYPTFNYLKTTSSCADINIKTGTDRYVKVCFLPQSGGRSCQADYKLAKAGSWKVIATNVKDKTQYQFHFRSEAKSSGSYAS